MVFEGLHVAKCVPSEIFFSLGVTSVEWMGATPTSVCAGAGISAPSLPQLIASLFLGIILTACAKIHPKVISSFNKKVCPVPGMQMATSERFTCRFSSNCLRLRLVAFLRFPTHVLRRWR